MRSGLRRWSPYATGTIFDSAIPQADRSTLLAFGFALFMSGLATAAFKLTQGIATLRIQGKMEYKIQSALWDRLRRMSGGRRVVASSTALCQMRAHR